MGQIRDFRLHDGGPPSLAAAMAERKPGYDIKAVRSTLMGEVRDLSGGATGDKKPKGGNPSGGGGPRSRPQKVERQYERHEKSDSSSSQDAREPKPAKKKAESAAKGKAVTALPDMQGPGKVGYDKAVKEGKSKFSKHCMNFLFLKCTRGECKFKHTIPKGFKVFVEGHGFKKLGKAAKGVAWD